ncbi:MAG: amidohydrolase [Sphingobacteriales bacterium]|nr:MAG: amidohydrolase [Sphingobacteriales bacterium]
MSEDKRSSFKIDVHTHILPEKWPDLRERYGYGGFVRLEHHKPCCARMLIDDKFFREVEWNTWDPQQRITECDHTQVDVQVLSTVPVMFSYWAKADDAYDLSMILNDHIAGVVRDFPKRFIGLGTIPMQDTKLAIKELERCTNELGLAGIQIGTNINNLNLNDPALFDIFVAAQDLGAAVFVHPWEMMGEDKIRKYWLPWLVGMPAETSRAICSMIFGGIFEKLPNLKVCFAHGGGSFPATFGRISHGFEVRPDLCAVDNPFHPKEYIGKFYIDSLVHDENALKFIVDFMGANKIALGSDYPFPLGELHPGKLIENSSAFNQSEKEFMLYKSALEWLNLNEKQLADLDIEHLLQNQTS